MKARTVKRLEPTAHASPALLPNSAVVAAVLGVLRVLRGWAVYKLLIAGYAIALGLTYIAPPEIIGLAYDSGGVTTNIVSVPLIAAIGLSVAVVSLFMVVIIGCQAMGGSYLIGDPALAAWLPLMIFAPAAS